MRTSVWLLRELCARQEARLLAFGLGLLLRKGLLLRGHEPDLAVIQLFAPQDVVLRVKKSSGESGDTEESDAGSPKSRDFVHCVGERSSMQPNIKRH